MTMREKIETFLNLSDRETKRRLLTAIGTFHGLYDVTVKPRRSMRSNQANRFYWGVVVKAFRDFLAAQGETLSSDEAHDLLKTKFLRREIVNKETGEPIGTTLRSTTALDTAEFGAYLESCIHWLDEMFGIALPDSELYQQPIPARPMYDGPDNYSQLGGSD